MPYFRGYPQKDPETSRQIEHRPARNFFVNKVKVKA